MNVHSGDILAAPSTLTSPQRRAPLGPGIPSRRGHLLGPGLLLLYWAVLSLTGWLDPRTLPKYADEMDPLDAAGEQQQLEHERKVEQREEQWLAAHKLQ